MSFRFVDRCREVRLELLAQIAEHLGHRVWACGTHCNISLLSNNEPIRSGTYSEQGLGTVTVTEHPILELDLETEVPEAVDVENHVRLANRFSEIQPQVN